MNAVLFHVFARILAHPVQIAMVLAGAKLLGVI